VVRLVRGGDELDVRPASASSRSSRSCSSRRRSSRRRSSASRRSHDPVYEEADADYEGWWAEQAEALHWFEKWDRCSTTPTRRSTSGSSGGKLNVAYNCLDRHVEAGNGDRVAFHWRGEEGEERDVTYADLLRDVQRSPTR
jgi:hypothetical protein